MSIKGTSKGGGRGKSEKSLANLKNRKKPIVNEAKVQNYTQFAVEKGYATTYDSMFQAQINGSLGLAGSISKRSVNRLDNKLSELQKSVKEGKRAYEDAIFKGEIIDPSGEITVKTISKERFREESKQYNDTILQGESYIRSVSDMKTAYLKNGKLKKGYQMAMDDIKERVLKAKEKLELLKNKYNQ